LAVLGGPSDDILISGTTSFDDNNGVLVRILAEWQRTDETFAQRVDHLRNGGGENGQSRLIIGQTVFADNRTNALRGGGGDNWFFVGPRDDIADLNPKRDIVN